MPITTLSDPTDQLPEADLLVECGQSFVPGWSAGRVRTHAAAQVAAERERWHDLAVAFRKLDDLGFIGSYGEEDDDACSHWLAIARQGLAAVWGHPAASPAAGPIDLDSTAKLGAWQPIETAPKDGTPVIVWPPTWTGVISCARWNNDQYAKKPKPYWRRTDANGRATESRDKPPTHWTLLAPPDA